MKKVKVLLLFLICIIAGALVAGESGWVVARGSGTDRPSALKDAFRAAMEKYIGVYIDAEAELNHRDEFESRIATISNGDLKHYDVLRQGVGKDGRYEVVIKAQVEKSVVARKFRGVVKTSSEDVRQSFGSLASEDDRDTKAVELLNAVLKDFDPIVHLTKTQYLADRMHAVRFPKDEKGREITTYRVPKGKKLLSISYRIRYDHSKYFKEFLPRLTKTLEAISVGPIKRQSVNVEVIDYRPFVRLRKVDNLGKIDWQEDCEYTLDYPISYLITRLPAVKALNTKTANYDFERKVKWSEDPNQDYIWAVSKCFKNFSRLEVTAYPVSHEVFFAYREWMRRYLGFEVKQCRSGYQPREDPLKHLQSNISFCDESEVEVDSVCDEIPLPRLAIPGYAHFELDFERISTYMFKPFFLSLSYEIYLNKSDSYQLGDCSHLTDFLVLSPTLERQLYVLLDAEDLAKISSVKITLENSGLIKPAAL